MNLEALCQEAVDIAREAGALLQQRQGAIGATSHKSSAVDLVTESDLASERLIVARLGAAFPDHAIVSEEGAGRESADHPRWIVDPLDGTINYAHGVPVYAVSLALWHGRQPLVGVVFNPAHDDLFTAVQGGGSWLTHAGQRHPLRVSPRTTLIESLLATGFPYDRHTSAHNNLAQVAAFLKQAQGLRRAGSAALDLCYVAAGRYDGYWEFRVRSWDMAAGVLMVQEAGGTVSHSDGTPFSLPDQGDVVASNGHIHPAMLAVLHTCATKA